MMKALILITAVALSGCASMGDLEVMNDVGLGDVRKAVKVYDKTRTVVGAPRARNGNKAAVANRAYGHVKNMRTVPRRVEDIPYVVRDYKELERYLRSLP